MHGLTDRQAEVLRIVAEFGERGVMCWQIRDRIYPADSPMRTRRTAGRGASGHNGSIGALGNLAAGRICAALDDKGLICRRNVLDYDSRYILTAKGHERLGTTANDTLPKDPT